MIGTLSFILIYRHNPTSWTNYEPRLEIDAFVVRNGCSLTLYKAGTHEQKTFKAENEDLIEKDLEHSNEKSYSKYYYYYT